MSLSKPIPYPTRSSSPAILEEQHDLAPSSPQSCSLFVGDLSRFCSEEAIAKLFSEYGRVEFVKIMTDHSTKAPMGYGFVTMSDESAAQLAMKNLHGHSFCGRELRVKPAEFNLKTEESRRYDSSDGKEINSVHVRFRMLKLTADLSLVTEEVLRKVFAPHGVVIDCCIKNSKIDPSTGLQTGYAFVHFPSTPAGMHSCLRSVDLVTGNDGVEFNCEVSKHVMRRFVRFTQNASEIYYAEATNTRARANRGGQPRHGAFTQPQPQYMSSEVHAHEMQQAAFAYQAGSYGSPYVFPGKQSSPPSPPALVAVPHDNSAMSNNASCVLGYGYQYATYPTNLPVQPLYIIVPDGSSDPRGPVSPTSLVPPPMVLPPSSYITPRSGAVEDAGQPSFASDMNNFYAQGEASGLSRADAHVPTSIPVAIPVPAQAAQYSPPQSPASMQQQYLHFPQMDSYSVMVDSGAGVPVPVPYDPQYGQFSPYPSQAMVPQAQAQSQQYTMYNQAPAMFQANVAVSTNTAGMYQYDTMGYPYSPAAAAASPMSTYSYQRDRSPSECGGYFSYQPYLYVENRENCSAPMQMPMPVSMPMQMQLSPSISPARRARAHTQVHAHGRRQSY